MVRKSDDLPDSEGIQEAVYGSARRRYDSSGLFGRLACGSSGKVPDEVVARSRLEEGLSLVQLSST